MTIETRIRSRLAVLIPALCVFALYIAGPLSVLADDTGPAIGPGEYERFDKYVEWSD
jgi:hypothetical protein